MSVLDARMRVIAAEVHAELTGGQATADAGPDRVTELEQQVAELADRVDKLESASQSTAIKRVSRKATSE